jgi:hypothetical protein
MRVYNNAIVKEKLKTLNSHQYDFLNIVKMSNLSLNDNPKIVENNNNTKNVENNNNTKNVEIINDTKNENDNEMIIEEETTNRDNSYDRESNANRNCIAVEEVVVEEMEKDKKKSNKINTTPPINQSIIKRKATKEDHPQLSEKLNRDYHRNLIDFSGEGHLEQLTFSQFIKGKPQNIKEKVPFQVMNELGIFFLSISFY